MKVLELKPYEGNTATIEVMGALNEVLPKGTSVRFLKGNLTKFLNKEVSHIVLHVANGENKLNLALTKPLTAVVAGMFKAGKKSEEVIAAIATNPVIEVEIEGVDEKVKFLSMPQTTSDAVVLDKIKPTAQVVAEFNPEELAW